MNRSHDRGRGGATAANSGVLRSLPPVARGRRRSGRSLLRKARHKAPRQEPPPHAVEIGQAKQRVRSGQVLRQTPEAHLGQAPEMLDHLKRMFAPSPLLGPAPVRAPLAAGQGALARAPAIDLVSPPARRPVLAMALTPVGLIPIEGAFLP